MKTMTLFGLLDQYSVLIPHLQRNYVHGRDDAHAKEVREHFVTSLDECINGNEMNLDVIYGIRDKERNVLIPIDGQQRLTTLWLSAVYAATTSNDNASRQDLLSKLSRFSYESRPLAVTFCRWLTSGADVSYDTALLQAEDCWGEDPTVHSMLTTLRLIHDNFKSKADSLLNVLCENKIHFEFSEVHGKDSDLYVKINARGKQLTQWENFKGVFASKINDDSRKLFNEKIEKLSDLFYDKFEQKSDEWKKLPDQAFFALIGRLADYVLRTSELKDKPFVEGQHKNLSNLANSKVNANQPYVPVDEFYLGDIANRLVLPFLRMVNWVLDNEKAPFKYWDGSKGIPEALFYPENADERDFSLFLYEYFSKYQTGECLNANGYRALRLVANILENEARQPKDESASNQFNRIRTLKLFLNSGCLYGSTVKLSGNPHSMQWVEEKVKAELYVNHPESIGVMQNCERLMHGRIRIALLASEGGKWINDTECGASLLAQKFKDRLEWIKGKLEAWDRNDDRKGLLVELVQYMPWDIAWNSVVPVNLEDSTYRIIVSNDEFAPWLQRSLLDQSEKAQEFDPNNEYGRETYAVDWRESLCKFIRGDIVFENEKVEDKNDYRRVRWHDSSYYLFTKTNNPKSFPIGDWRISYYLDDAALREVLNKWCRSATMQMNYSGEFVFEMNGCKGLYVHLWARGIAIEFVREEQRSGVRLVEITQLKKLGCDNFFENISKLFSSNQDALFQALQNNSLNTLLCGRPS